MNKLWKSFMAVVVLSLGALAQTNDNTRAPSDANDWRANAAIYQIFVRSFQDSNGDGVGDLNGVRARLGDLQNLGVNTLWLMPIFPSPSYHGYDVTDYTGINPDYGTLEDFDALVQAAKSRNMRVILDWVPNHTASSHPWFLESKNPNSAKRNWYVWRDQDPNWNKPWGERASVWFEATSRKVVFAGTIQSALGGNAWNPNGTETQALEVTPGTFELIVQLPAGQYEYKVAIGGGWAENYGANNKSNGDNIAFKLETASIVKFVFDNNRKRVLDSVNNPQEVSAPKELAPPSPGQTSNTSEAKGFYYGAFWGGMPDLNWRNPDVQNAMNAAAKFWLARGIAGFRLDAIRYVVENANDNTPDNADNIAWAKDFARFVRGINPEALLIGEIWTDTETVAKYVQATNGALLAFNFDLQRAMQQSAQGAFPDSVQRVLARVNKTWPKNTPDVIFASNHDLVRPKFFNAGRYRSLGAMLLTLPGIPTIYYGEEIGLPNGPSNRDEDKRTPMPWNNTRNAGFTTATTPWQAFSSEDANINVETQRNTQGSLYRMYKNLLGLRKQHAALRTGGYAPLLAGDRVMAFARFTASEAVVVAINLDSDPANAKINFTDAALAQTPLKNAKGTVQELTLGKTLAPLGANNAKNYTLKLAPYGLVVLRVQ